MIDETELKAEAEQAVDENRDLFERIAAADLPISEDIERILDLAMGGIDD